MVALVSSNINPKTDATSPPDNLDFKLGNDGGREAQKTLITSVRSLSVSFQGESFSLQVSKLKQIPLAPSLRKGNPSSNGAENCQSRWPGRLRQPIELSKSVDFSDEKRKRGGSDRIWCDGGLSSNWRYEEFDKVPETNSASDTESVSSGSSLGLHDNGVAGVGCGGNGRRATRGIVVPARFWQETNNRLRRQPESSSPTCKNKSTGSPSLIGVKKLSIDNPSSSPRLSSCTRGQSSPGKLLRTVPTSPITRAMSPSRVNNASPSITSDNLSNRPSILSFYVDIRRGKIGETRIGDAHRLRLLYNRVMQWRLVNARAESSLSIQKLNAEKSLYTAWVSTSKLRESVRAKRVELQLLRQNLKFISILKGQMAFLEDWALIDHDYSISLLGAMEALRASTLRLPVVDGARADIQKVKDAISSAVDVMQAMASSICLLLPKVDEVHSLVSELTNISTKECGLLNQCKDLLAMVASMQVKDCSLRTHILQQKCLPSTRM